MQQGRGYHKARPLRVCAPRVGRRDLLGFAGAALVGCSRTRGAARSAGKPEPIWGVQSGDVSASSAVVWCRADRPSRLVVEWSLSPGFDNPTRVDGPSATLDGDLVAKAALANLPAGRRIHYRARFDGERPSDWIVGALSTPAEEPRDVVVAWSGDTNGQGWGIDPARGGMPTYAALLARAPDLFIHCGDSIYADGPIPKSIELPDGGLWNNLVVPAKTHVAETLDDYRGNHLYARHCTEVRALSAAVPVFSIWDDHEVRNNWFPGEVIDDARYQERRMSELAVRARRAMYEHAPTLRDPRGPMYRVVHWGPLLDVFLLDGRGQRTPNEPAPPEGGLLGAAQRAWLENALAGSTATWKVVACDMPLGLVIFEPGKDGRPAYDGFANEDGPPKEREVELARLLAALRARRVANVVWVTADVHYAAAHRFDPARAAFRDFDPFWELVAGPMHATAFPQKPLDATFGPEVAWSSAGPETLGTPAAGVQHFGLLRIDARSRAMTVTFVDARNRDLHTLVLAPASPG